MAGHGTQNVVSDRAKILLMGEKFGIRWDMRREPLARSIVRVDKIAAFKKEPCESENVGLLRRLARPAEGVRDCRIKCSRK